MAEEIKNSLEEVRESSGTSGKHKSHKKKKSSKIYTVIIVLLLGVMAFSGYKIISTLKRDKDAKDVYDEIMNDFVVVVPDDTDPAGTAAAESEHSGENETQGADRPTGQAETEHASDPTGSGETGEVIVTVDGGSGAVTEAPPQDPTQNPTQAPSQGTAPAQPVNEEPLSRLSVDFTRLKSINKDVCAWLQGQSGIVNYPVVQGSDNSYYLKHLIDGSYNGNGTLFVHAQNHFMQDDVTYIFGHHMYGGAMFGSLKKYDSSQYYWSNPEFRLYTPEKTYTLRIYCVFYGTGAERITFNFNSEANFNSTMASYASRALHTPQLSVSYGDKLVCLCTCAYQVTDGRYFVLCKVMN